MAFDIAKFGRKPYQKLEQPEARDASGVHIRRYLSGFFGRMLGALLVGGTFLVLGWAWYPGADSGFGRYTAWIALSGAAVAAFAWRAVFGGELIAAAADAHERRFVSLLALLLVAVFGIGSLARLGLSGAFGLTDASSQLSFLGAALGAFWLFAITYGRGTANAAKQVLVAWFLGSTVLAGATAYDLARNGYAPAGWMDREGMLLVFAITIFLMIAFAMFQKRGVKLLWSASIALHAAALFAWDAAGAWLVLIGAISALLVFQMWYSKKLWQRNFTYPLQIWVMAVLLLLLPVKMFTGISVPHDAVLSFDASLQAVADQGFVWFGGGLGSSDERALASGVSFVDFGSLGGAVPPMVGNGYLQLYLEAGSAGALAWLGLYIALLAVGVRFWRARAQAFKEGSMPESEYLGAVVLVAITALMAGMWFFPFSFLAYWLYMLLAGCALVLWRARAEDALAVPARRSIGPLRLLPRLCAAAATIACIALLAVEVRLMRAEAAAFAAASQEDALTASNEWQRVTSLAPWNRAYPLHEAQSLIDLLATPISIDAQRAALERVTSILSSKTRASNHPITHWRAARLYSQMETYAEGSALLGWEQYQKARELWPTNVFLAVAISEFYRTSVDALVSGNISAAELKAGAAEGLKRALELEPAYLPARLELAFLVEQEEGAASALAALEPWEDSSPQIMYHIARLYLNDGNLEQAIEKLVAVINQVPNHSNAHYSLGVAYFRLERYEESLAEFEAVLELNPGSEDVQAKIEQVRAQFGE